MVAARLGEPDPNPPVCQCPPILFSRPMLTTTDRQIIDFERSWWLLPGPKEMTMTDVLGLDPADYYARLRVLLDSGEADRYDPLTVRRLRRFISGGT